MFLNLSKVLLLKIYCPFDILILIFFYYFTEGKFFPRAILTDLEPGVLHSIQGDSCAQLFNTNNFIAGPMGAANNFAKGYYVGGPEVIDALMEVVR